MDSSSDGEIKKSDNSARTNRASWEEYVSQLREMLGNAPDEQTRRDIERMIQKMENM